VIIFYAGYRLESCLKLLVKHFLNLEIKPYKFIHCLNGSIVLGESVTDLCVVIYVVLLYKVFA